jgi:hypothetical protein
MKIPEATVNKIKKFYQFNEEIFSAGMFISNPLSV